jgi:cell shape-determining protein MreC
MKDNEKTTIGAFRDDAKRIKRRKLESDDLDNEPETLRAILQERDELEEQVKQLKQKLDEGKV